MSIPTLKGITAQEIQTERIKTRVLFSGAEHGVPVIFLHGNVSTATFWEETMLALPEGYRGIAPDQRGYGDAEIARKIDATRGLGDLSDDVKALMDYLEYESAHLVGHSAGGSVLWRFMMDYPAQCRSVTLVNPGSPHGFGGTKGLEGEPLSIDFAGSGAGTVNADFPKLLEKDDRSDGQGSPRWTMNTFYFKPPFVSEREEDLLSSMLATHTGIQDYPGDHMTSATWPAVGPGNFGMVNALSPKHLKSIDHIYEIDPKPPILWVRGVDDQIVSDASMFDLATLGKMGLVPGWPGEDSVPPQPMVGQTRHVLQKYLSVGGFYTEVPIEDAGHTPYLEKPVEFNKALHDFLNVN